MCPALKSVAPFETWPDRSCVFLPSRVTHRDVILPEDSLENLPVKNRETTKICDALARSYRSDQPIVFFRPDSEVFPLLSSLENLRIRIPSRTVRCWSVPPLTPTATSFSPASSSSTCRRAACWTLRLTASSHASRPSRTLCWIGAPCYVGTCARARAARWGIDSP